jgi:CRISPR/Cas system-associated exonuclease Cas4 (RecB family)
MITKTAYLSYLHCAKRFWLEEEGSQRAEAPDPVIRRRMREGTKVGRLARSWFPGGWLIPFNAQTEEVARRTAQALAEGETTLFEAAFVAGDLLIKADILQRMADGWHLIEVKATNSVKEEHVPDVAFQLFMIQQAGLDPAQASVMHLNRECRAPDLDDLFITEDVWAAAQEILPQVAEDVAEMRRIVELPEAPAVEIGRFCSKRGKCPFYDICWQGIQGLTLFDIPRLNAAKEQQLRGMDVLYLADIPPDFPLTVKQWEFVDFFVEEKGSIDKAAIQAALDGLQYPLYFFDFETIGHAVPVYDGMAPYQQTPFQYSCHVLQEDGTLSHHEYLHTEPGDPRPALLKALLDDIGPTGHIIVYYAPFERGKLQDLAQAFPEHDGRLQELVDRLWDQLLIFKKHYRHYAFGKSNSLKSVLPVVVPGLSYEGLPVTNGLMAQVAWEEMMAATDGEEKERLAGNLLAYCKLDTLAMVEMHQVLASLA